MNISLSDELKRFVQKKVASGAFSSEEAVLHEAVRRFREEDQAGCCADATQKPTPEDLIDYEAIDYCARKVEGKEVPLIEDIRRMLSKIPGSMARAVIEEREDRI